MRTHLQHSHIIKVNYFFWNIKDMKQNHHFILTSTIMFLFFFFFLGLIQRHVHACWWHCGRIIWQHSLGVRFCSALMLGHYCSACNITTQCPTPISLHTLAKQQTHTVLSNSPGKVKCWVIICSSQLYVTSLWRRQATIWSDKAVCSV